MTSTGKTPLPVLLVDDEVHVLEGVETILNAGGIEHVIRCQDSREVLPLLAVREAGIILLDLWLPYLPGEELLAQIVQENPEIPVVVITGANDVDTAVRCIRQGAFDYLVKPVEGGRLLSVVRRALEMRELRRDYDILSRRLLSQHLDRPEAFAEILTQNDQMFGIFQYIETVAETNKPVLITGETGTGKELIARAIHEISGLDGPFVAVNVAGVDDAVFSDTLFGHARGAFTGADGARQGLIERAAGGTLFLDEIGDLSTASQLKLLRLIEYREYYPLGVDMPKQSNARIVCATNRTSEDLRGRDAFRRDLYYRLRTHHIHVPPLRERKDDLPLLVDHLLGKAAEALGKKKPTPPSELFTLLRLYDFPGNVRELEALVFDAVSHHKSHILSLETFRKYTRIDVPRPEAPNDGALPRDAEVRFGERLPTLQRMTDMLILEAVRRSEGNQRIAASVLGISRTTLNQRLKSLQ
ncbi:MAG: sigma-54-dependent Fis family transcriptional regulator [Candidatus Hydrogenedentes bacterium]|nr:sigma-54-dependent Fis family transcriptional regulator [Candidatus Hydrogenedentota bacterium]